MDDMKNEMVNSLDGFVGEIKQIIDSARANAVRSVDLCRVQMYWNIGKRIFEKEQQGKERADYGSYLIKNLSKRITPDYGSGFSVRQLEMCRQFYRTYPIANTVCSQLNWSQYKLLIAIPDTDKRKYYQLEAVNNGWTKRELERQINSLLYERLLLSNDKEAVLAVRKTNEFPNRPRRLSKIQWYWSSSDWNAVLLIMSEIWRVLLSRTLQIFCLKWARASLSWQGRSDYLWKMTNTSPTLCSTTACCARLW